MPQSAYYSIYAQHPALSYFDHPPMIGWLLWTWITLLGKSTIAVRLATFTTTLATQLAFLGLARQVLPARSAGAASPAGGPESTEPAGRPRPSDLSALAVFSTTAVVTLLSWIAVPDVPLLLFWTLALWALARVLLEERRSPSRWNRWNGWNGTGAWLLVGVLMGLALLSKYTAVYLQGGLILFLVCSPDHRRLLRTPGPWLALVVTHVVALPVYVWNASHGWVSFLFQSVGRAEEVRGIDLGETLGFLASQAVVFLPVPLFAFLWIAGRDLWRAARSPLRLERLAAPDERAIRLFLLAFSVPVFATCIALSTISWVKINWPMPAYVTATLLVVPAIGQRAVRWHLATAALLHLLLAVQLVFYPVPVHSDDTWFGWEELALKVESRVAGLSESHPGLFVFSADNYKTTAELRFYSDLEVYGMNVIGWNALELEYIGEDPRRLAGRDALFVRNQPRLRPSGKTERYLGQVRRYFASVRELPPIEIRHRGETVRRFRLFLCEGYRGPDRPRAGRSGGERKRTGSAVFGAGRAGSMLAP